MLDAGTGLSDILLLKLVTVGKELFKIILNDICDNIQITSNILKFIFYTLYFSA